MKNQGYLKYAMAFFAVFLYLNVFAGVAGAEEVLQNGNFEAYDPVTLAPDNWQVIDGNVEIYQDQAYDGAVSVYSLGGTMIEGVDTPNPPQSGTLVQLIDLSTMAGWDTVNWLTVGMTMHYRIMGCDRMYMFLDYLPATYDDTLVTADDAAWNSVNSRTVSSSGTRPATTYHPWREATFTGWTIPKVRWARVRFVFDVQYKSSSYFEDGPYYIAVDSVSVNMELITPEMPCTGNLLNNPGFETVVDGVPDGWNISAGRITAIGVSDAPFAPPYAGDWYAGNIGGYVTPNPDPEGDPIDHPDPPQYGSLVQLVDLSDLDDWSEADFITFSFNGRYIRHKIGYMRVEVAYLPETYNDTAVTWDNAAWSGDDVVTAIRISLGAHSLWEQFATDLGSLPRVRWVLVRLEVEDSSVSSPTYAGGQYLGGFDQICFQAAAVVTGNLIQNPSFEQADGDLPAHWHQGLDDGTVHHLYTPRPAHDLWFLGNTGEDQENTFGRVYQVIDLAGRIPNWTVVGADGKSITYSFVKILLEGYVANIGGARVAVGLEYLPGSYNDVEDISWDDPAWQAPAWTSDGSTFTNSGGDAVDLGMIINHTTVNTEPPLWHGVSYDGWLNKVRWLRLRIEVDAADTGGEWSLVGIDGLSLWAECREYGPYSGLGYLPEATFWEDPDAPDKPAPGWVGPEGDGICGGYSGITERNYVNPAFAGFADDYENYLTSGQFIAPNWTAFPEDITGRPFTDAGWIKQIVTLGDMDLGMLADYFGSDPSGLYHPGEITAVFNQSPIVNSEGHDFATFENGFVLGWTSNYIFGELAYVEVSSNGTDFIRMPTHSLMSGGVGGYGCLIATGLFGLTGKHVNAYGDSWGTPFDLDWIVDHPLVLDGTVDLMDIRYVKQVDVPGGGPEDAAGGSTCMFFDSYGNRLSDSWVTWGSGGADLDAVAVLNSSATDSDGDHITDYWDNCSQTTNDNQYDTDQDGYGNMCDCDIDGDEGGDGTVSMADYFVFVQASGSNGPIRIPGEPGQPDEYTDPSENWNADADFDGDNYVTMADYFIFTERFGSSAPFN